MQFLYHMHSIIGHYFLNNHWHQQDIFSNLLVRKKDNTINTSVYTETVNY